jgi:hypothetical protein
MVVGSQPYGYICPNTAELASKLNQVGKKQKLPLYVFLIQAWSILTSKKKLLLVVAATLILQFSTATDGAGNNSLARNGCLDKCGNVSIPIRSASGKQTAFWKALKSSAPQIISLY